MYSKDYLLNETERLARLVAKLLGLKSRAGQEQEIQQVYKNSLVDEFGLTEEEMLLLTPEAFKEWLKHKSFNAAKLDALAKLLYYYTEPFEADAETLAQLQKVLLIFDMLEQEHHQQSFDNLSKRNIIQHYIQQHHA
jgi:hypothetical protein